MRTEWEKKERLNALYGNFTALRQTNCNEIFIELIYKIHRKRFSSKQNNSIRANLLTEIDLHFFRLAIVRFTKLRYLFFYVG